MRFSVGFLFAGLLVTTAQAKEPGAGWLRFFPSADPDLVVYSLGLVFILTFLLTFYVAVLYFRERRRIKAARAVGVLPPAVTGSLPPAENHSRDEWRVRALTAETLANNQAQLLREKLMPELAEFVKQNLVQGLAAQRDALLAMQQQALHHLAEMETRLASIQAPFQERIRAYEDRIVELEKEITSQNAEVRELTRTILQLMRKKLEDEQTQAAGKFD